MLFTVDADGDQGTLPLPKFKLKDSWMTNTNKVQSGWQPVYYPIVLVLNYWLCYVVLQMSF